MRGAGRGATRGCEECVGAGATVRVAGCDLGVAATRDAAVRLTVVVTGGAETLGTGRLVAAAAELRDGLGAADTVDEVGAVPVARAIARCVATACPADLPPVRAPGSCAGIRLLRAEDAAASGVRWSTAARFGAAWAIPTTRAAHPATVTVAAQVPTILPALM